MKISLSYSLNRASEVRTSIIGCHPFLLDVPNSNPKLRPEITKFAKWKNTARVQCALVFSIVCVCFVSMSEVQTLNFDFDKGKRFRVDKKGYIRVLAVF